MGWNVNWLDDTERVVVFEPYGKWTWEEYVEASQRAQEMIRGKAYVVDTLYRLGDHVRLPSPNALSHLRDVYQNDPPNSGAIVAIGGLAGSLPPASPRRTHPAYTTAPPPPPFHPCLSASRPKAGPAIGGVFSVALSIASRRPAVSRHPALWSPDFPPSRREAEQRPRFGLPALLRSSV